MRTLALALVLALTAGPAVGQDCTFSIVGQKEAPTEVDSMEIAMPLNGTLTVSLSSVSDTVCTVTDANGFDGSAGVSVPEGEFDVLARATGKKGGVMLIGEQAFQRGKGKAVWAGVEAGSELAVTNAGLRHLQVRLVKSVAEAAE